MRFIADGPEIPDDLLRARDEGRVVFFCGSGVSRARAGLPDFYGLTQTVIDQLRATPQSSAVKRFTLPERVAAHTNGAIDYEEIAALVSADQIFSDLYREFPSDEVDSAVAQALTGSEATDIGAHEILYRLARSPSGALRLVTTNFDRLFECCGSDRTWTYPDLPDLTQSGSPNGIVYLHGRIDDNGQVAEPPGFVLSSAEFGEAYMADGRATRFIKDLIDRFVVVFVGYSADDPPVRYLLEALGRGNAGLRQAYAFQAGDQLKAEGLWAAKGVSAIGYSEADGHRALWDTLEAWAVRADDPESWKQSVIELARSGPSGLDPHERGWVAHMVSTREGAKRFAAAEPTLPAQWLYVFDPRKRFARPSRPIFDRGSERVDPFDIYGLDTDPRPPVIDEDDSFAKRELPENPWNPFLLNEEDQRSANSQNISAYADLYKPGVAVLPPRLASLGWWVAKSARSPATLAWAASQPRLNPEIRSQLGWQVEKIEDEYPQDPIAGQWRLLLEIWETASESDTFDMRWYRFEKRAKNAVWTDRVLRDFERSTRPILKVGLGYSLAATAPDDDTKGSILRFDVSYPDYTREVTIPTEWRSKVLDCLKENLIRADRMEDEIGPRFSSELIPIRRGNDPNVNKYQGIRDLSGMVVRYVTELKKLLETDPEAARNAVRFWPRENSSVFARLRCWAFGEVGLVPKGERKTFLGQIADDQFWHSGNQRDLLTSLKAVWEDLSDAERSVLESRLVIGPARPGWIEDEEDATEWQAIKSLSYIEYLRLESCEFGFDYDAVTSELRSRAPGWKDSYAATAADETGSRGGIVTTITEYDALLNIPTKEIVARAEEVSGRRDDFLKESDPFLGLARERPAKAIAALRQATADTERLSKYWRTFFSHDVRKNDSPRLSRLILGRLSDIGDELFVRILYSVTWWLRETAAFHTLTHPSCFDPVVDRIIALLEKDPELNRSSIVRSSTGVDWSGNALNSAPGHLADALMADDRRGNAERRGFPEDWSNRVRRMLSLPGDGGALTIAALARNLSYIHYHDASLAEHMIALALERDSSDIEAAFWSGFQHGKIPTDSLYRLMKPHMLEYATRSDRQISGYRDALSAYLLGGWRSQMPEDEKPLVTDSELSAVILNGADEFRSSILHYLADWTQAELSKDKPTKFLEHVPDFFTDVWPRQRRVRTPAVSRAIKELLTTNATLMDMFFDSALPHLVPLNQHVHLYFRDEDQLVEQRPRQLLKVIAAILPTDITLWPYGLTQLLDRLVEADGSLIDDLGFQRIRAMLD